MKQKTNNFLKVSSNYSEVELVKSKLLRPILEKVNKVKSEINYFDEKLYMIPNNNKKYYLFIFNKSEITSDHKDYKILYFFPENQTNTTSDFFMEIDKNSIFNRNNYLYEGYMYNGKDFLITDLISVDNGVLDCEYNMRYSIITETISMMELNGHLTINIHPIFSIDTLDDRSEQLYRIFEKNFKYNEICAREMISSNSKEQRMCLEIYENVEKKLIKKGKLADVYHVYNVNTNENEGLLYVGKLEESLKLKNSIKESEIMMCKMNIKFRKWQLIN
jgi:hypothetical protein